jgi:uncharacterized protein (UPF0333 family)
MKNKKGQILLIIVMVLATILTVVFSVTFQSTNESKTTKLEEDSQKALAAAEAAAETAIKTGSNVVIGEGLLSFLSGMTGNATIESLVSNIFTSPAIAKDSAYTFYLGDYDSVAKTIGASINQPVTICFAQASPNNPVLEVTLVKATGVKKYVVDPESRIANAATSEGVCPTNPDYDYSYTIPGADPDIGIDSKLLFVRLIYGSSKLVFSRSSNFPIQGKVASSQATTKTGVSKKVVLFQSNPQIPAEFFTTTF